MNHPAHGPLKQPREGIAGTDRSGSFLLSLDEAALEHRRALVRMARVLRDTTLVGNPAPSVQRIATRIADPRPGDLVVETGRGLHTDPRDLVHAFGILLERRHEWEHTDEDWTALLAAGDYLPEDRRPAQKVWYVQYGPEPSHVCRWENAAFMTLPIGAGFTTAVGVATEHRATLTSADVADALADAGFDLRLPWRRPDRRASSRPARMTP